MSMHSNSDDIQQKDIDGVPHDSMVITQQATYMNLKQKLHKSYHNSL